jgi:outer membrane protein assembly factor BamB
MIGICRWFESRPRAAGWAHLITLAALIPVIIMLAGCGGSAVSTTSGPPSPSTGAGSTQTSAVASPSTSSPAASSSSTVGPGGQASDWLTYHHDVARSGLASDQAPLGTVRQAWTSTALDGAVYAQPLVAGGRVFVATEGNTVYALDAATGAVSWQQNLGEPVPGGDLPCGNIDPSGITGTPVIDAGAGLLFVVANLKSGPHHELFALDLTDGAVRWHRAIDPPGLQPAVEQERGALTLSAGRVYVPFGGLYGDCGPYKGAVVSAAADGTGDLASYIVPTRRMAGIWAPGGPAVDQSGDIWVTTGNSASQSAFDFGNALIRLDAQLQLVDYFAPSNWAALNAGDIDMGSLGAVLLPSGRVLAVGKDGIAYLADAGHLRQVGTALTSLQIGGSAFGTAAVSGSTVFIPTTGALVALNVAGDKLSAAWKADGGSCTPIVAGGAVWAVGYDGTLRALDPASGKELFHKSLGRPVSRFISPAAAGGMIFVPDGDTVGAFTLR